MRSPLLSIWLRFCAAMGIAVLVRNFISPPPPGYSIALLGALSVVIALQERLSQSEKAVWAAGAFALMALEMVAITHDRSVQNMIHVNEFNIEQAYFKNSLDKLTTLDSDLRGINELDTEIDQAMQSPSPRTPAAPTLKQRALDMAKAVLEWVSLKDQTAPRPPQRVYGIPNADSINTNSNTYYQQQESQYESSLAVEWQSRFSNNVAQITDELRLQGVMSPNLNSCRLEVEANNLELRRRCAQDIEEAALKLR